MRAVVLVALIALAEPSLGGGLMDDCRSSNKRLPCINRNGLCVEVEVDGQRSTPISRDDRQRLIQIPDMDDVCWQVAQPVSATFRVQARGGGLQPDFIGRLESVDVILVPLDDYDPDFDHSGIQSLRGFDTAADGAPDGTWQVRAEQHFRTPGSGYLTAGEYVAIVRLNGEDNWESQEILIRVDPQLEPFAADLGTASDN